MDKNQTRNVAIGGIAGAFLLPICLIGLWLGIAYLQHATSSQMSQWPIGVIVITIVGGPLGAAIGASVVLVRHDQRRLAGILIAVCGIYTGSLTVLPALRALLSALLVGRPAGDSLEAAIWGAVVTAPFLIIGTWLLRTSRKPK